MTELAGAIALTLIALFIIAKLVYTTLFAVAFAGWRNNMGWATFAFSTSVGIAIGWWVLVGTHIHVKFG